MKRDFACRLGITGRHYVYVVMAAAIAGLLCNTGFSNEPIPILNSGFEQGEVGWTASREHRGSISIDNTVAKEGAFSLKMFDDSGKLFPFYNGALPKLEPKATYKLTAAVLADESTTGFPAIKIECYDKEGRYIYGEYKKAFEKITDWTDISLEFEAPYLTDRALVLLRLLHGKGPVWFDDVRLYKIKSAGDIRIYPERILSAKGSNKIDFELNISDQSGLKIEDIEFILDKDGQDKFAVELSEDIVKENTHRVTLKLPDLPIGVYNLTLKAKNRETALQANVYVYDKTQRNNGLDSSGFFLDNGKRFFPIGIYHVWPSIYPMLAQQGINSVQGLGTALMESIESSLNAAQRSNIKLWVPLYINHKVLDNLDWSLQVIEKFNNHPAVLGWNIADEPEYHGNNLAELPIVYYRLRQATKKPLIVTVNSMVAYEFATKFVDVLFADIYPLPAYPISMIQDHMIAANQHLQPWQSLVVVLQSGWGGDTQPTYEQARAMVYLSIINGAKGIFWYSYQDPGWDLSTTPLWKDFKELNKETAKIAEIVLNGNSYNEFEVEAKKDNLSWKAWQHNEKVYLLAVNHSKSNATFKAQIPDGLKIVNNEAMESNVKGNNLEITFSPETAKMFVFQILE